MMGGWIRIGLAVAAIALLAWSHRSAYQAGRAAEQAAIVEKIRQGNENAGRAAEDWRTRYRRCAERGGLFDFETGACDR